MHFLQNYWKGYQDKEKPFSSLGATSVLFFFFFFSILKVVWVGRLLYQDSPLRRRPLAGVQGWGHGEVWGSRHVHDGRTFSSQAVSGDVVPAEGRLAGLAITAGNLWGQGPASHLPVRDRFPPLFYKSLNTAFVFEVMKKPQVKRAGIKTNLELEPLGYVSQTLWPRWPWVEPLALSHGMCLHDLCVHTAPSRGPECLRLLFYLKVKLLVRWEKY